MLPLKSSLMSPWTNWSQKVSLRRWNHHHGHHPLYQCENQMDLSIRIRADYSKTINANSDLEQYPLPTIEEIRTKLSGGQKLSTLDLSQAYHQLELEENSRAYTMINTHRGLYQYKRLPFGIHSAVSIFQRTMENLLGGIDRHFSSDKFSFGLSRPYFLSFFLLFFLFLFLLLLFSFLPYPLYLLSFSVLSSKERLHICLVLLGDPCKTYQ